MQPARTLKEFFKKGDVVLLGLLAIALIIPFGKDLGTGNRSWVYIPHVPFSIQPGEIAKLAYIVVLAWMINK